MDYGAPHSGPGAAGGQPRRRTYGDDMRATDVRTTTLRLTLAVLLALSVSACDKCGNWFGQGKPNACTSETPK